MTFKCKIGLHSWDGCKCTECGKMRDEQHDWSKDCEKCSKCGKTRDSNHVWLNDCEKCSKCGSIREDQHDWSKDCEKCTKCSKTRNNKHNWSTDCMCSKCGLEVYENHSWYKFKCQKCGTFDYLDLLTELSRIAWVGDILFEVNGKNGIDNKNISKKVLSEFKTESKKQEYILNRYNYLVTAVSQSFGPRANAAANSLLYFHETMKYLDREFKKH